jgi:hypothetical protein
MAPIMREITTFMLSRKNTLDVNHTLSRRSTKKARVNEEEKEDLLNLENELGRIYIFR